MKALARARRRALSRTHAGFVTSLLSCSALVAPASSHAQEPEPTVEETPAERPLPKGRPVTLAEVIARARTNPPAVLAALATLQRFQAQEHMAKAAYLPRVSVGAQAGYLYNNYPYLITEQTSTLMAPSFIEAPTGGSLTLQDRVQNLETFANYLNQSGDPKNIQESTRNIRVKNSSLNAVGNATVDWTLVDFSRGGAIDSASAQKQQQAFAAASAQRTAIQAAVQLYVRGLSAQLLIDDARLSSERRTDQLKSIAALVRAGVRPAVDAQRAEIEAVAARHMLDIRTIEHQAAMASLASALGEDPASPMQPVVLEHDPFVAPNTLRDATELAVGHRPEVKQAESAVAASQANHRSAVGMRLPVFGASGTGSLSYTDVKEGKGIDGGQINGSAFLYMRWSALDVGVWRRAKVTSAAVIEAQKVFETTLLQLKAQVAEALYGAQIAKAQLDRATETLAAATTTRQAQNERYRAGVSTLLELLDAEELEQNARRSRIEASRDYDIARAQLLSVCGTIEQLR
ncbi:MAG: TolC family protein [Myxococcales bacterium]